jgi:hypothetical protein
MLRPNVYRALAKGLQLTKIVPKKELMARVKSSIQGAMKAPDSLLDPIKEIKWDPRLHGAGSRDLSYGMNKPWEGRLELNPLASSPRGGTGGTFLHEATHQQQFGGRISGDLNLLRQGQTKLREASAEGRIPTDMALAFDPFELHARDVTRQMVEMPARETVSDFAYDLMYRSGFDSISKSLDKLGRLYPAAGELSNTFRQMVKSGLKY